jgi:PAS domain S-box-containing protein
MRDSKHRRGGLSPEEGREAPEPEQDEREQATRLVAAAHFASAFDSAPIGMALIDMEGRWLQVNDALCRITGYTRKELKATTLRAITHPDDVDRDADSLRDLLDGRVPSYQTEKRYRHAWGHHLWVLLTVSLVRDERGCCSRSRSSATSAASRSTSSRRFRTSRNGRRWRRGWSSSSITIS